MCNGGLTTPLSKFARYQLHTLPSAKEAATRDAMVRVGVQLFDVDDRQQCEGGEPRWRTRDQHLADSHQGVMLVKGTPRRTTAPTTASTTEKKIAVVDPIPSASTVSATPV
jgi:hypothetical protein